jgi:hypothetical protein
LTLAPTVTGLQKVEYLSNDFIEMAHILMVIPASGYRDALVLSLPLQAVALSKRGQDSRRSM